MDLAHFKDMHYRLNRKCQEMMAEGETAAAKGELLMLYTAVDMLEERVRARATTRVYSLRRCIQCSLWHNLHPLSSTTTTPD